MLVLSIYYVLVPVSNTTLNDNGINADGDSLVSVTDGEDAYFENLELAKVSKFNDDIDENPQKIKYYADKLCKGGVSEVCGK